MEIIASQKSVTNGQDLPNSPPDRLSSIKTTASQDLNQVLSSNGELKQSNSTSKDSTDQTKMLTNETLQKLICALFQAKKRSLQNINQNSFPQIQQLQQLSQHLTQQTSSSSLHDSSQSNLTPNDSSSPLQSNSQFPQKQSSVLSSPSLDDFPNGSPAPSGRRSPSFTGATTNIKQNQMKQSKTVKKNERNSTAKKYKNKNLTKSKISRQDSRSSHPQKIIFTPSFEYINFADKDTSNSSQELSDQHNSEEINSSLADFNITEAHKRLEIFEDRIIAGKSKYVHPAYSVLLEKEESEKSIAENRSIVLSEEEIILSKQYDQENDDFDSSENQKIPLFWEKRVWDLSDDQMDPDENEALKERITEFTYSSYFGERESMHGRKRIQHPRHHQYHINSRHSSISKEENENLDEDYNGCYDYEYDQNYDEYDSDGPNSNSDFSSTDDSDNVNDDTDEEDRSGSYHYHMSGISGAYSASKRHNHKKFQRTKSSPIPRNLTLYSGDKMATRKKSNKKKANEEITEEIDNSFETFKSIDVFSKKGQAKYRRQLKKSSKGTRANTKVKVPKASASSTIMYISNLYYETDDSCDETDAELF